MWNIDRSTRIGISAAREKIRRARRDRKGGVAITVALMLPVLVACTGLVFDAGYYRWRERVLQSASDAAAMAAGQDAASGLVSATQMFYAANEEAVRNGFMDGNYGWNGGVGVVTSTPQGSIQVNSPPSQSPAYKGQVGYVEVVLTENRPRMFSSLWQGPGTQPIVSVSVVSTTGGASSTPSYAQIGSGCVLVLDPVMPASVVSHWNQTTQDLKVLSAGCEMVVNSNGNGDGTPSNSADAVFIVMSNVNTINQLWHFMGLLTINQYAYFTLMGSGGNGSMGVQSDYPPNPAGASNPDHMSCSVSPCGTPPWWFGTPSPSNAVTGNADPYINTITPSGPLGSGKASSCIDMGGTTLNVSGGVVNLPAGHYCKGFNISGGTVNLSPGVTIVDNQFTMSGGTLNGLNGSTLVLGNGFPVQFNNAHLNLKAPVTGVTAGIALTEYADSPNTAVRGAVGYSRNGNYYRLNDNTYNLLAASGPALFTSGTLNFTGAIYLPRRTFYAGPSMMTSSFGGTSGCGQIVSYDIVLDSNVVLGNSCSGTGVLPFGSIPTNWALAVCKTPAGALDPNCAVTTTGTVSTTTTGNSNVKFVQ